MEGGRKGGREGGKEYIMVEFVCVCVCEFVYVCVCVCVFIIFVVYLFVVLGKRLISIMKEGMTNARLNQHHHHHHPHHHHYRHKELSYSTLSSVLFQFNPTNLFHLIPPPHTSSSLPPPSLHVLSFHHS